jgi:hypothetical protein
MRREDDNKETDDDEFDFDLDNDAGMEPDMDMGSDDAADGPDFDADPDMGDDDEMGDAGDEDEVGDTESRLDDLEDKVTDILSKLSQVIAQSAVDDMDGDDDLGDDDLGDDDLGDDDLGDDDLGDDEEDLGGDDENLEAGYTIDDGPEDQPEFDDDDPDGRPTPINPAIRKKIEDRRRRKEMEREFGVDEAGQKKSRRFTDSWKRNRITENHLKAAMSYARANPKSTYEEMATQMFKATPKR